MCTSRTSQSGPSPGSADEIAGGRERRLPPPPRRRAVRGSLPTVAGLRPWLAATGLHSSMLQDRPGRRFDGRLTVVRYTAPGRVIRPQLQDSPPTGSRLSRTVTLRAPSAHGVPRTAPISAEGACSSQVAPARPDPASTALAVEGVQVRACTASSHARRYVRGVWLRESCRQVRIRG